MNAFLRTVHIWGHDADALEASAEQAVAAAKQTGKCFAYSTPTRKRDIDKNALPSEAIKFIRSNASLDARVTMVTTFAIRLGFSPKSFADHFAMGLTQAEAEERGMRGLAELVLVTDDINETLTALETR